MQSMYCIWHHQLELKRWYEWEASQHSLFSSFNYSCVRVSQSTLKQIWILSVQRIYSGLKVIEAGIYSLRKLQTTFKKLYGRHTDVVKKFDTFCVTYVEGFVHQLWHMTGFQLFCDGCHMWGRKCSLFPEHMIPLLLGSSCFYPFIL